MDKYEYKVRADEIKDLISLGEYVQAAEIADTIDWRRVKSVMMLCTISDLYKINRRYEDARDMLLLAYERRPGGRTICYSLCELSIKMEEFVEAVEYYKEFVQVAPKDSGRYILQYKLYEAQDVSLEERIAVLEELKKRDYREKWAYELAYLYHRIGLGARCVEECDELILWFGEGKYVVKAMELKMLHEPLSPAQQKKYDNRFNTISEEYEAGGNEAATAPVEQPAAAETAAEPANSEEMEISVNVGQYNTINLQEELAEGLKEVLAQEKKPVIADPITRSIVAPMLESDTESLDYPEIDEVSEDDLEPAVEQMEASEVFFGETEEITEIVPEMLEASAAEGEQEAVNEKVPDITAEIVMEQLRKEIKKENVPDDEEAKANVGEDASKDASEDASKEMLLRAEPPKFLASVLSQESDGQLSLVMPESERIEKQITGQMSIDDILAEWERVKKENQEERQEKTRQYVLQHTGAMFTEFEAAVRDGLLEQLEREKVEEDVTVQDGVSESDEVEELVEIADFSETAEEFFTEENVAEESGAEEVATEIAEEEETFFEGDEEAEEVAEDTSEETSSVEESAEEQLAEDFAEEQPTEASAEEQFAEELAEEQLTEASAEEQSAEELAEEQLTEASAEEQPVEDFAEEQSTEASAEEASAEESEEEQPAEEPVEEQPVEATPEKLKPRSLTREEKELFAPYIQSRAARAQLVNAIDGISLAAYTGNLIITGDEGMDTMTLAKNIVRELQTTDSNFTGKVAKISGAALNKKNASQTLEKIKNGALIISKASEANSDTANDLHKALQQENFGIVVVLVDTRKAMDRLLNENEILKSSFTARMDVEAMSNDMLVAFGKRYAREREYAIDDFGVLALHTRIEALQTIDHAVTVIEVQEIVDEAIRHANRKTLGHFFDILFARRYDSEDMIILGEKDFV